MLNPTMSQNVAVNPFVMYNDVVQPTWTEPPKIIITGASNYTTMNNPAPTPQLVNPFIDGDAVMGFRSLGFVPVDYWRPTPADMIFVAEKGMIVVPISPMFNMQDDIMALPINVFCLNTKRCYNNMRDHISLYLNYFEKFYDPDKELISIYAYIKLMMDTQPLYDFDRFFYDLTRMILNYDCRIFAKANQMNEENYSLALSYRNNRNPVLQYTEYHAKLMMRASLLMNMVIPLITHFMYVKRELNTQDIILTIFQYILNSLCDNVNIIEKLYETATTNIRKNANDHSVLWEMQNIRGITPITHAIECVKNIIEQIMPKYVYDQNIIHFNYKSIINSNKYQITDISFEFTFVSLSSSKRDEDNNSEFDKFESYQTKESEAKYLVCRANYQQVMENLEMVYGPFDSDEIAFINTELSRGDEIKIDEFGNVTHTPTTVSSVKTTQKLLIFLLMAKYFHDPSSLKEINRVDYIKLMLIAKNMLISAKMLTLAYIISGKFETSKVKSINLKEKAKIEAHRLYNQVYMKYGGNEDALTSMTTLIGVLLASKVSIIDYRNPQLNGIEVPVVSDTIIDEFLQYILMI